MTDKRNGKANLIPMDKRTLEEQKAIAKKGGQASGVVRRKRKTLRKTLELLLPMNINQKETSVIEKLIIDIEPQMTGEEAIAIAQMYKAIKGDTHAAEFVRDTVGDKPKEEIEQTIHGFDKYFKADNDENENE